VQTWAGIHWSDDPTFKEQYARIVGGLHRQSEARQTLGAFPSIG
jgi:hypothetical protein